MITLDAEALEALVRRAVRAELEDHVKLPAERLAYSESDAAELLGLPLSTLRDARRRGQIKGHRKGRGYYYTRGELLEWLAAG